MKCGYLYHDTRANLELREVRSQKIAHVGAVPLDTAGRPPFESKKHVIVFRRHSHIGLSMRGTPT